MFDQKPQTNPFEKMQNFRLLFSMFLQSKVANFLSTRSQNTEFWPIFLKNKKRQNFQFQTKNNGLAPLEKCNIYDFLKYTFLQSKMASFLSTRSQNALLWPVLLKKNKGQNFQFQTKNHGLTTLKKCKILDFFKSMFLSIKQLVFYLQGQKKVSFGLLC